MGNVLVAYLGRSLDACCRQDGVLIGVLRGIQPEGIFQDYPWIFQAQ